VVGSSVTTTVKLHESSFWTLRGPHVRDDRGGDLLQIGEIVKALKALSEESQSTMHAAKCQ